MRFHNININILISVFNGCSLKVSTVKSWGGRTTVDPLQQVPTNTFPLLIFIFRNYTLVLFFLVFRRTSLIQNRSSETYTSFYYMNKQHRRDYARNYDLFKSPDGIFLAEKDHSSHMNVKCTHSDSHI